MAYYPSYKRSGYRTKFKQFRYNTASRFKSAYRGGKKRWSGASSSKKVAIMFFLGLFVGIFFIIYYGKDALKSLGGK